MLKYFMEWQSGIVQNGFEPKIYTDFIQSNNTFLKTILCLILFPNGLLKNMVGCSFGCHLIQKNLPSFNCFSLRKPQ